MTLDESVTHSARHNAKYFGGWRKPDKKRKVGFAGRCLTISNARNEEKMLTDYNMPQSQNTSMRRKRWRPNMAGRFCCWCREIAQHTHTSKDEAMQHVYCSKLCLTALLLSAKGHADCICFLIGEALEKRLEQVSLTKPTWMVQWDTLKREKHNEVDAEAKETVEALGCWICLDTKQGKYVPRLQVQDLARACLL